MIEQIKNIAHKNIIKLATVIALMNISAPSFAQSKQNFNDNKENQTDLVYNDHDSKGPVYKLSESELRGMSESSNFELVKMDLNVNYETDKAELSKKYEQDISQQFTIFLNNINKDNVELVDASEWQVFSATDERPTISWGENGNEALAMARGDVIINVLQKILNDHEFKDLDNEAIVSLKNKKINNKIADAHQDHQGEIFITDIINSETQKNYTSQEVQEIEKNNPKKYLELLSQNRISQFKLEIPIKKLKEFIPNIDTNEIQLKNSDIITSNKEELVKKYSSYKNVVILIDNSYSMVNDKRALSDEIQKQHNSLNTSNFYVGHYSDILGDINKVKTGDDINAEIMKRSGASGNIELSVQAVAKVWEKLSAEIKPEEKSLIEIHTDESLQRISKEDMNTLKNFPENIEVKFIFYVNHNNCVEVPLSVVETKFEEMRNKLVQQEEKKIELYKSRLKKTDEYLAVLQTRLIKASGFTVKSNLRSAIKANEKNQVHYQNLIESSYNKSNVDLKITISSFTDDNGKTFNLENAY